MGSVITNVHTALQVQRQVYITSMLALTCLGSSLQQQQQKKKKKKLSIFIFIYKSYKCCAKTFIGKIY